MIDLDGFFRNPNDNFPIESKIPSLVLDEGVVVGIDEAGRGPVLGPMVYSAAYCPVSIIKQLEKEKGFQDSKTLTEKQRSEMFEMINKHEHLGWSVSILSPNFISNSMLKRSKYNLNALSHDTAISLIQKLQEKNIQIKEVYLDTVGPADKYEIKLKQIFPDIKKIKVSNKADSIYKIVSIASICAKVIRDHIIKNWKFIENFNYTEEDYGSGYPSDPKTKEFLTKIFDPVFAYPTFVRFSWSTITKIMEDKAVPCKWDDDEEENEINENCSITNYFKKPKTDSPKWKSSSFFIDRKIEQINNIDNIFH